MGSIHTSLTSTLATEPKEDIPESVRAFESIWRSSSPASKLFVEGSVEAAVDRLHAICPGDRDIHILVTGSQHLVGNVLFLLQQSRSNPERWVPASKFE